MAVHPSPWCRVDAVGSAVLYSLQRTVEDSLLPPGAAVFALREGPHHTLYFTPAARTVADALGASVTGRSACGPPFDDPRLRLLGGDRHAWIDIVRPSVAR